MLVPQQLNNDRVVASKARVITFSSQPPPVTTSCTTLTGFLDTKELLKNTAPFVLLSAQEMPPKSSSLLSTIANNLKPHKAEAIQRIRFNTICLVATLILSYLLPVPSLLVASRTVFRGTDHETWSIEWFKQWFAFGGKWHCWGRCDIWLMFAALRQRCRWSHC